MWIPPDSSWCVVAAANKPRKSWKACIDDNLIIKGCGNLSCQLGGVEVEEECGVVGPMVWWSDGLIPSQGRMRPSHFSVRYWLELCEELLVGQQCSDLLIVIRPSPSPTNNRNGVINQEQQSHPDHHLHTSGQYFWGPDQLPSLLHTNWRGAKQILPVLKRTRWAG